MVFVPLLRSLFGRIPTPTSLIFLFDNSSRTWIVHAFVKSSFLGEPESARGYLTNAIEVLEWGIKNYSDVPVTQRGAIFTRTFLRGVHNLLLHEYAPVSVRSEPKLEY